ncbi:MAG: hypothetical protein CVU64_07740 [Deltaproteobacteria bacterium HGW-Deltaproteobacteria-21]|nr:MAG: hypothetical protein CVU64_07740 [Deltaproteobacteria bacterium HGW-Deltaproteobacteria-21]
MERSTRGVQVTEESNATAAVLNQLRASFYLLFSRSFSRELDRDTLKSMEKASEALIEAFDLLEISLDKDFQTGRNLLRIFFEQIRHEDDKTVIADLARGYASLFLGVGSKTVSPCESLYRSEARRLFQSSHFEVQRAYQEIGMIKNEQYNEPDDHIAVELSYMARLCELAQEALGESPDRSAHYLCLQKEFLEKHLLSWIPDFSRDLLEATDSPFYRGTAHLLNGYIKLDNQLIESMIQEIDPTAYFDSEGGKRRTRFIPENK